MSPVLGAALALWVVRKGAEVRAVIALEIALRELETLGFSRDPENYADFCADVAEADVFIASLIFIEDLAQKVVDAVAPHRDR